MSTTTSLPIDVRIGLFERVWRNNLLPMLASTLPSETRKNALGATNPPNGGADTPLTEGAT